MAEDSHNSDSHEPEYGPTYYAPVEMPLPRLPRPPFWMIAIALISVVITWLPLAIIARARVSKSSEPRISIMQDMGIQPKFREQMVNTLFADDRAMRPKILGTVAYGSLQEDDNYYHGFVRQNDGSGKWTVVYATSLPQKPGAKPLNLKSLVARGEERFNIYCYVCHGFDGSGRGPVNQRAMEIKATDIDPQHPLGMSWTPAAQLTSDTVRVEPDGMIFNKITNGYRSMPSYAAQIPVEDRWAIVAYVRTLQLSQGGLPVSELNETQQNSLQGK